MSTLACLIVFPVGEEAFDSPRLARRVDVSRRGSVRPRRPRALSRRPRGLEAGKPRRDKPTSITRRAHDDRRRVCRASTPFVRTTRACRTPSTTRVRYVTCTAAARRATCQPRVSPGVYRDAFSDGRTDDDRCDRDIIHLVPRRRRRRSRRVRKKIKYMGRAYVRDDRPTRAQ